MYFLRAACALILLCLLMIRQSWGQSWHFTAGPPRARINHLIADPSNPFTLYAVGNGLYRSADSGSHWTRLASTPQNAVAVNPLNPNTLFADNLKSSDGGATFSPLSSTAFVHAQITSLAFNAADTSVLYAGLSTGALYTSTDAGGTWQALNNGIDTCASYCPLSSIAVSADSPQVIIAGNLYKTVNGGISWQSKLGFTAYTIVRVPGSRTSIFAGTAYGLYHSTDNGDTWSLFAMPQFVVTSFAIDPLHPDTMYIGAEQLGAWRTTDGGVTWLEMNHGIPGGSDNAMNTGSIIVSPQNPSLLWRATLAGIYRSVNGGNAWSESDRGFGPDAIYDLAAGASDKIYALGWGVYSLDSLTAPWQFLGGSLGYALAVDPGDTEHILESFLVPGGNRCLITENGGATWSDAGWSYPGDVTSIQFVPNNRNYVYATGTASAAMRSTDRGTTWKSLNLIHVVTSLAISPYDPSYLIQGGPSGIFISTDTGATWTAKNFLGSGHAIRLAYSHQPPYQLFAAVNDSGVFRSFNDGGTWEDLHFPLSTVVFRSIDADAGRGFLIAGTSSDGFYFSTDVGGTWRSYNTGLPSASVTSVALYPPSGALIALDGTYGVFLDNDLLLTGVRGPVAGADVPDGFMLLGNYPNPFNPTTTIRYRLPAASAVRLTIYDMLGKLISTTAEERQAPGEHEITWTAAQMASGVYFYQIEAAATGGTREVWRGAGRVMLVK